MNADEHSVGYTERPLKCDQAASPILTNVECNARRVQGNAVFIPRGSASEQELIGLSRRNLGVQLRDERMLGDLGWRMRAHHPYSGFDQREEPFESNLVRHGHNLDSIEAIL